MKWWVLFGCCVFSCGNGLVCAVAAKPVQEAEQRLALTDLPKLLHDLVSCHPGKKAIDEDVLLKSREKLFSLFDPDKDYLLLSEVAPFVDPKNGKRFLKEYQQNDFTTYCKMLEICREAVQRSRNIRRGFFFTDSKTIETIRERPQEIYEFYAMDGDELTARLFHKYVRLIADRLPNGAEGDSKQVGSAVMLAEKELEAHEGSWLTLDTHPGASKENLSSAARLILKTILSSLDTHSDVMGKKSARDIRERLTKEAFGTGVIPFVDGVGCHVKKIVSGSPAARLGVIKVNDQIMSLDGHPCSEMTLFEIDEVLNQETNGAVRLTLKRAAERGKSEQILMTTIPRSCYTVLEGRLEMQRISTPQGTIAIITLHSFYRGGPGISSSEDLKKALTDALSQGPIAGVILDLRDNGGGYITEAVRVVGQFIKTGVVMTACYADGSRLVFRDLDSDIAFAGPMVVLTSKGTASAAEIVAQALKDYERAIIVGDPQTYGKGSIQMQTVTDIGEKELWVNVPMRFTVGRFYSVSGYSPQHVGVKADIIVPGVFDRPRASEEEQVDPRLKEKIDPLFHDSLDDVKLEVKGWYQEHYLPFLQQRMDSYRQWIPELQKKSEQRMKQNPLLSILKHCSALPEGNDSLKRRANELQMQEAIAIERDLIQECNRRRVNAP
jgi:carboxyl-terminal processing protease